MLPLHAIRVMVILHTSTRCVFGINERGVKMASLTKGNEMRNSDFVDDKVNVFTPGLAVKKIRYAFYLTTGGEDKTNEQFRTHYVAVRKLGQKINMVVT
jgi:hypothetical protein